MRDYLFSQSDLRGLLETGKQHIRDQVLGLPGGQVLNVSETDLCEQLVEEHRVDAPAIKRDEIYAHEPTETDVDVSGDPRRAVFHGPAIIRGTRIVYAVPFDGDGQLLLIAPMPFMTVFPRGRVEGQEILLAYETPDQDADAIKQWFNRDLSLIEQTLTTVRAMIDTFNSELPALIRGVVAARRQKLLADQGLAERLGVPIRRRVGAAEVLSPPVVRRRAKVHRSAPTTAPFKPEPALDLHEYNYILTVMERMATLMERSPRAFARLDEEDLRDHFLLQLNGHYEGGATGETFNVAGKTDILIRHEGRNVFIAECKFWRGPKGFVETLDQLLSYTSWRDTKTAVVIFNRGTDHTGVLEKIRATVPTHPCFKREIEKPGETHFRYIFHQPADKNREMIVSVLAFVVPSPIKEDEPQ